jgi:putative membrane protein
MKRLLISAAVLLVPVWAQAQSQKDTQPYDRPSTGTTTGSPSTGSKQDTDMGSKSDTGSMTGSEKTQVGEKGDVLTKSQLINKLHKVNQMEIEVGNLAQTHAKSAKVKQFGETLVKDHTKADKDVLDFAKANNIVLSEAGMGSAGGSMKAGESGEMGSQGSMGVQGSQGDMGSQGSQGDMGGSYKSGSPSGEQHASKGQMKIDKLSQLQGDAFDREFLTMMAQDHEKLINTLENTRGKENDKKLDALIDKLLPTLRDHQRTAERLQREVPSAS